MPIILELCCGWKSVSRAFERSGAGWTAMTLDILPKFKPTLLADVTVWDYRAHFAAHPVPDVVWASPPCRTFTKQAWGRHRDAGGSATTKDARVGDACARACLGCIAHLRKLNPGLIFFVENPLHGAFRHLPCVQPFLRAVKCQDGTAMAPAAGDCLRIDGDGCLADSAG